jgi:hypothetical protein
MSTIESAVNEIGMMCIPIDDTNEHFETMEELRVIDAQNGSLMNDELTELKEMGVVLTDIPTRIVVETDFFKNCESVERSIVIGVDELYEIEKMLKIFWQKFWCVIQWIGNSSIYGFQFLPMGVEKVVNCVDRRHYCENLEICGKKVGNEWKMKWVCGKGVSKWKEGGGNEIHFFSNTQKWQFVSQMRERTRTKCSTRFFGGCGDRVREHEQSVQLDLWGHSARERTRTK